MARGNSQRGVGVRRRFEWRQGARVLEVKAVDRDQGVTTRRFSGRPAGGPIEMKERRWIKRK